MAEVRKRHPLPALISLIALILLTSLVWWRVMNRDSGSASAKSSCSTTNGKTVLPRPESITVAVVNSTERKGLAKTTSTALIKTGFKVSTVGNDTGHSLVPGVAEIRYSPDQKRAADLLEFYFPTATQTALPATPTGKIVVSVGDQFKALATAPAVKAAMTAANVSIEPLIPTGGTAQSTC